MLYVVLSFLALSPQSSLLTLGGLRLLLLLQNTMRCLRFKELEISFVRPHVARGTWRAGHAVQRLVRFIMAAFWSNVSTEFRIEISATLIFLCTSFMSAVTATLPFIESVAILFQAVGSSMVCTHFCLFAT